VSVRDRRANEALRRLERVAHVRPVPDAEASTATVFLADDGVPPVRRWHEQFVSVVNGSYRLRGVEVTLTGSITVHDHGAFLELVETAGSQQLRLVPLRPEDNVRLNSARTGPRPLEPDEPGAYEAFLIDLAESPDRRSTTITGTLRASDAGLELAVRRYRNAP
jgi:galactose oxidase